MVNTIKRFGEEKIKINCILLLFCGRCHRSSIHWQLAHPLYVHWQIIHCTIAHCKYTIDCSCTITRGTPRLSRIFTIHAKLDNICIYKRNDNETWNKYNILLRSPKSNIAISNVGIIAFLHKKCVDSVNSVSGGSSVSSLMVIVEIYRGCLFFQYRKGKWLAARPIQLAELPRSEFDPELFSHSAYVKHFLWHSRQECRI